VRLSNLLRFVLPALLFLTIIEAPAVASGNRARLGRARTFMYQIQGLNRRGAITALAKTDYPLLVLEPTNTNRGSEDFNTARMIRRLRRTPQGKRRVILAYIDIGEAEDYRIYWESDWSAPSGGNPGNPDFILTADPDGWSGNYPVAYWDARWQDIWLGQGGLVRRLAAAGFDGVYLDWVEAYDDDTVKAAARRAGVDAAHAMVDFIRRIKRNGRLVDPNFVVVAQNAPYLIDKDSRYSRTIDGLGVEDTWFGGEADAAWNSPRGGDIPNRNRGGWSTGGLLRQYQKYIDAGLPVFSIDYCLRRDNADQVYGDARAAGLRSLVTRVALSRLTTTPPP